MASKSNEISSLSLASEDDEEEEEEDREEYRKGGYHFVLPGDQFLGSRYVAQKKLGWGNFSTVWLAYDTQTKKFVALKIQKSAQNFTTAALEEIEILRVISEGDPQGTKGVVKLFNHFTHSGPNGTHVCMVFEVLGESLLKLLTYNRYRGLELPKVKEICRDVLLGLNYLHKELGIIHTDLKPENVMLVSSIDPSKDPQRSGLTPIMERPEKKVNGAIGIVEKKLRKKVKKPPETEKVRSLEGIDFRCKIVDMGNACWKDIKYTDEIQTRQYRAPEVILGYEYTESVDMWSFACLAFEIATGDMLFEPKNGEGFDCDQDHLALMIELLGKFPRKIAVGGSQSKDFFDRYGDLKNIKRFKFWPLNKVLLEKYKFTEADANEFADFLTPILDYAPEKRPTAEQCLQHPWISGKTKSVVNDENRSLDKLEKAQKPAGEVEASNVVSVKEAVSKFNTKETIIKENNKEQGTKPDSKKTESTLDARDTMRKLSNNETTCKSKPKDAQHTIDAKAVASKFNNKEAVGKSNVKEAVGTADSKDVMSRFNNKEAIDKSNVNESTAENKEVLSRFNSKETVSKSNVKEAVGTADGKGILCRLNAKEAVSKLNAKEAVVRQENRESVSKTNAKESASALSSEQSTSRLGSKEAASRLNTKKDVSISGVKVRLNNKEDVSNISDKESWSTSDTKGPVSEPNDVGRLSVGEAVARFTTVREAVSKLNTRVAK